MWHLTARRNELRVWLPAVVHIALAAAFFSWWRALRRHASDERDRRAEVLVAIDELRALPRGEHRARAVREVHTAIEGLGLAECPAVTVGAEGVTREALVVRSERQHAVDVIHADTRSNVRAEYVTMSAWGARVSTHMCQLWRRSNHRCGSS